MRLYAQSGSRPQEPMGGVDAPEVTPVPIPNTTVKGRTAEGTTLETAWENRWMPPSFKKSSGDRTLKTAYIDQDTRKIQASKHGCQRQKPEVSEQKKDAGILSNIKTSEART